MFFFFYFFDKRTGTKKKRKLSLDTLVSLAVLQLIKLKDSKKIIQFGNAELKINDLSYRGVSFNKTHITQDLDSLTNKEICDLAKTIGYEHTSKFIKWDIEINGERYLIRNMSGNTHTIINHASREKYLYACNQIGISISILDKMVSKYWENRLYGLTKEDVIMGDPKSSFNSNRNYLVKLLGFMSFHSFAKVKGVKAGDNFCTRFMDIRDPFDLSSWNIFNQDNFINILYDYLVFSIRDNKGMPGGKKFNPDKCSKVILPWVKKVQNKTHTGFVYKGALEVRVKRLDTSDQKALSLINKYKEQIDIVKANNQGEREEILFKLFVVRCRMNKQQIPLNGDMVDICTLGNTKNDNYLDLPAELNNDNLFRSNAEQLVGISNKIKAVKSPSKYKADIYINGIGISLKSGSSNPSIVNTTPRKGFIRVINSLHDIFPELSISPLDDMVKRYWDLRLDKRTIGEDITISDNTCPFTYFDKDGDRVPSKEYLEKILNYFCFDGTGRSESNCKAVLVLTYADPTNPTTWVYNDRQSYIDSVWEKLCFSLRTVRDKDSHTLDSSVNKVWKRMITVTRGKERGSEKPAGLLNVRVKNK